MNFFRTAAYRCLSLPGVVCLKINHVIVEHTKKTRPFCNREWLGKIRSKKLLLLNVDDVGGYRKGLFMWYAEFKAKDCLGLDLVLATYIIFGSWPGSGDTNQHKTFQTFLDHFFRNEKFIRDCVHLRLVTQ